MKTLLYFLLFTFQFNLLLAQTDTEFWFAVPYVTDLHDGSAAAKLWLTSTGNEADITIEQPYNPQFAPITISLLPNETKSIDFNDSEYDKISGYVYDLKSNFALHITSTDEITTIFELTQYSGTFQEYNNPEIFTLKGTNGLGYDFFTPFQTTWNNHFYNTATDPDYSGIDIVATEDNTEIEITFGNDAAKLEGGDYPAGSTIVINLDKGQTYHIVPTFNEGIRPSPAADDRLYGTHIKSDKPIAVTIKDDSVQKEGSYDLIGDQLVPIKNIKNKFVIGHEYMVMRGLVGGGDKFYVLATEDNTNITVDGTPYPLPINMGQQIPYSLPEGQNVSHIYADKPIYVFHVSGNTNELGGAVLPSVDGCAGSLDVSFVRSVGGANQLYLFLMTKSSAINNFKVEVEGVEVPDLIVGSMFELAGSSGLYVLKDIEKFFIESEIPADFNIRIYNTASPFHLGIINGRATGGGIRYGYLSNYDQLDVEAIALETNNSLIQKCNVDTVQLKATGGLSYLWSPAEYVDNLTSQCPNVFPPKGKITTFSVKVLHPCDGFITKYVSVLLNETTSSIDISEKKGCSPFEVSFKNTSSEADQFILDLGDGTEPVTSEDYEDINLDHTYVNNSDTISYFIPSLTATNYSDCIDIYLDTIWVYPAVKAIFTSDKYESCEKDLITFTNNSTGNILRYNWDFKDGTFSTENNTEHQFTEAGEYNVSLITTSVNGCKDTSEQIISINKVYSIEEVISACNSYTWDATNETYTESGSYTTTVATQNGCDSIIILNLTINHQSGSTLSIVSCDSYAWPNNNTTYYESGIYYDTLSTTAGCDSIVTLYLSINKSDTITETVVACDSYLWPETGDVFTESGIYFNTLTNSNGCDSVVVLDLTINHKTETTQYIIACNSYTWETNNITYYESGIYYDTISTAGGCDSIMILNLTINIFNNNSETVVACDTYTWQTNNITYYESGIYYDSISTAEGCDPIVTLDLTINKSDTITETVVACDTYTWPTNNTTYNESGIYYDTLSTFAGCDSIIKLDLTINTVDISVSETETGLIANAQLANYQWLNCDNNYSIIENATNQEFNISSFSLPNGNYAVEINQNGCIDTSACFQIIRSTNTRYNAEELIEIYPNPTSGSVNIQMDKQYELIRVDILNFMGQTVNSKDFRNTKNLNLKIDVPAGYYLLNIRTENNQSFMVKILKE